MTPKEKADELILKFENILHYDLISDLTWHNPMDNLRNKRVRKDAKKFSLLTIEFIIEQNNIWIMQVGKGNNNFWNEVKKEIKKSK